MRYASARSRITSRRTGNLPVFSGFMSPAEFTDHRRVRSTDFFVPPHVPRTRVVMDECPQGGNHSPIPLQGETGMICVKCGQPC